ncbi:MAG: DUF2946 family protein [Pseudolabrys sp.]
MRMGVRRLVSWAAIYAVALHGVLLGIAPITTSDDLVAGDPFSIICHSNARTFAPTDQTPGRSDHVPGNACEHCNLCSVLVPPAAPDALIGTVLPLRVVQVLRPVLSGARIGAASDPKLARGPPHVV